ncbi:hypothetical protein HDU98_001115 [Podochytrium sp. JEL0797]|nr:hypothetical protein HDU98_001115 [Podochytrium sp. JEL0797]
MSVEEFTAAVSQDPLKVFTFGMKQHQEGKHREGLDLIKLSYALIPTETYHSWHCLSHLTYLIEKHPPNASDEDFLKTLQNDTEAPTHHRAVAAFTRASLSHQQGDKMGSDSHLRQCIVLCDKITPSELALQIYTRDAPPRRVSVREYLAEPDSVLSHAKRTLESMSAATPKSSVIMGSVHTGPWFGLERCEKESVLFDKLIWQHTPGNKCDRCGVWAQLDEGERLRLKKCKQCLAKFYCSSDCQRAAWNAGHRNMCRTPANLVEFDLVRIHGLKNEKYSSMNGDVYEIRGSANSSTPDVVKWMVSMLGGGGELVVKDVNLTRVMFKEERWKWQDDIKWPAGVIKDISSAAPLRPIVSKPFKSNNVGGDNGSPDLVGIPLTALLVLRNVARWSTKRRELFLPWEGELVVW